MSFEPSTRRRGERVRHVMMPCPSCVPIPGFCQGTRSPLGAGCDSSGLSMCWLQRAVRTWWVVRGSRSHADDAPRQGWLSQALESAACRCLRHETDALPCSDGRQPTKGPLIVLYTRRSVVSAGDNACLCSYGSAYVAEPTHVAVLTHRGHIGCAAATPPY